MDRYRTTIGVAGFNFNERHFLHLSSASTGTSMGHTPMRVCLNLPSLYHFTFIKMGLNGIINSILTSPEFQVPVICISGIQGGLIGLPLTLIMGFGIDSIQ